MFMASPYAGILQSRQAMLFPFKGMWRSTPPKFYHHRADLEYQNDVGKVSRTASCNLPLGMHTAVSGRKVAGLIWIRFAFFSVACNTYLGLGSTYPGGHDDFW